MGLLNNLRQYSSVHGLPEYVKDAAVHTPEELQAFPPKDFADPVGRQLPVRTKAATWTSHLEFLSRPSDFQDEEIRQRLRKAAAFWGIGLDCLDIEHNLHKAAEAARPTEADYALAQQLMATPVRMFPIRDASEVKQGAEELHKTRFQLPWLWRKQAAVRLLWRSNELDIEDLPHKEYLEKAAGYGAGDTQKVATCIRNRAFRHKNAEIRDKLLQLYDEVANGDRVNCSEMEKIALHIDQTDRAGGLHKFYGRGVELPEEVCFEQTFSKMAAERENSIGLTNGTVLHKDELSKRAAEDFAALGEDFVAQIKNDEGKIDPEKAAEILPTLPLPDANLFVKSLEL